MEEENYKNNNNEEAEKTVDHLMGNVKDEQIMSGACPRSFASSSCSSPPTMTKQGMPVYVLTGESQFGDSISDFYSYVKTIGEGSFGRVYLAKGVGDNTAIFKNKREVYAVKEINKSHKKDILTTKFSSAILAKAIKASHANIIKYLQFLEDPLKIYIVSEFYSGPDFFTYLCDYAPVTNLALASFYLRQMAEALAYVHDVLGGLHRDVKPDNFVFENEELMTLKLIDFGCARSSNKEVDDMIEKVVTPQKTSVLFGTKFFEEETPDRTSSPCGSSLSPNDHNKSKHVRRYSVVGSVGYCAPEVFTEVYDERCDLYSLGIILSILVFFRWPFPDCMPQECDLNEYRKKIGEHFFQFARDTKGQENYITRNLTDGILFL